MWAKTRIKIAKQAITSAYLPMSQVGIILGEQSRSAHSSIIAINELHNSGNIIEECGGAPHSSIIFP